MIYCCIPYTAIESLLTPPHQYIEVNCAQLDRTGSSTLSHSLCLYRRGLHTCGSSSLLAVTPGPAAVHWLAVAVVNQCLRGSSEEGMGVEQGEEETSEDGC